MNRLPTIYALLAALCYGISAPVSKVLLGGMSPALMASLLYLGAGIGMGALNLVKKKQPEALLTIQELPYVAAMVALDIAAPLFLMYGLTRASSATVSLLNNFEIVATTVIALVIFKEAIGKRMWLAIALITISSIILSLEDTTGLSFSIGALFVLLACVCWGIENNCTRVLSLKNPAQIVVIKGIGSGLGSLLIASLTKSITTSIPYVAAALMLGFVAYGLSIFFYIMAQRSLGASRTSALYAVAPFIGTLISILFLREIPTISFWIALGVMLLGAYFAVFEKHAHEHIHPQLEHEHRHNHDDGHHNHTHDLHVEGEHSHKHVHESLTHNHKHTPDLHHAHSH